jgi:hypothetical protein
MRNAEQQKIENSASSDEGKHNKDEQEKKKEKKYLEEADEVKIGGKPELTEEEVYSMAVDYINKLKRSNSDSEKILKKLDKYINEFNVKKFMKNNPHMTPPDFYMVMFNETDRLVN